MLGVDGGAEECENKAMKSIIQRSAAFVIIFSHSAVEQRRLAGNAANSTGKQATRKKRWSSWHPKQEEWSSPRKKHKPPSHS